MKKTVAVVVTYNRKILLKECLEALIKNKHLDVLVVDNASTDGTYDEIKSYLNKKVTYINTGSNLGGAGGFNFGIKQIVNKDYDYCWIMDDDTIVKKDSLDAMLNAAKELDDKFSYLSSVALWTDNSLCLMNIQGISTSAIENYNSLKKSLLKIDYASFVSCFINIKCIKKVGLPIKDFFIYGDDMEYTMRLNKVAPGYLNPNSVVIHKMGSNVGINIIDVEPARINRFTYNYRNLSYIYKKYNPKEYKLFKLKYYYMIFKILLKSPNNKIKRISALHKGMKQGKKFNPQVELVKESR